MKSRILERLPVWAAAATFLLTASAYGWYHKTGAPLLGMDAYWLVSIVQIEWLAIHSFPFIMMVVSQRPSLPQWQGLRGLVFAVLLLFYLLAAHSIAGWPGVGLFFSLTAVTYLGFFVNLDEKIRKLPELGLRWLSNVVLLVFLGVWFELPSNVDNWSIGDGLLPLGGLYFLGLAGLELSGLYQAPFLLEAGRGIERQLAQVGSALPPTPALQSSRGPLYWAFAPIFGSAVLNILPLLLAGYVAGAGARLIDAHFEWPRSAHIQQWWFPAILTVFLLPVRCWQLRFLLMLRRAAVLWILTGLYLVVAVIRYRADPTYHFAYSLLPEDAYAGFLLLEVPLLFFLVPATWLVLAFPKDLSRNTRTSASGS